MCCHLLFPVNNAYVECVYCKKSYLCQNKLNFNIVHKIIFRETNGELIKPVTFYKGRNKDVLWNKYYFVWKNLKMTELFVYDSVRDFCPKCIYCQKIYLNRDLLAHHFLTRHLFRTTTSHWCPHCTSYIKNMIAHVQNLHPEKCLLCGENDPEANHKVCTSFVKTAIKNHFQKKISVLLNMLEGFESI